jgi:hypothetical protein
VGGFRDFQVKYLSPTKEGLGAYTAYSYVHTYSIHASDIDQKCFKSVSDQFSVHPEPPRCRAGLGRTFSSEKILPLNTKTRK